MDMGGCSGITITVNEAEHLTWSDYSTFILIIENPLERAAAGC